jgi:hypothetical protein
VIRLVREPAQEPVLTIDGQVARYVHGKFTPDVITFVYEDPEDGA